jgi:hypothetical protein
MKGAVTGVFSYSGRFIAEALLARGWEECRLRTARTALPLSVARRAMGLSCSRPDGDALVCQLEGEVAFLDDPRFVVGVAVQPWAVAGFAVVEDERDRGAVIGALEVSGLELALMTGIGLISFHRVGLATMSQVMTTRRTRISRMPQAQRRSCRAASSWSPAVDERCIWIAVRRWKAAPIRKAAA